MSENFEQVTYVKGTPDVVQLPAGSKEVVGTALMAVGLFATVYFVTGKVIQLRNKLHSHKS